MRLRDADAPAPTPEAVTRTRLDAILAGGTHHAYRDVNIPGVGPAKVRLLSRNEEAEVDLAVARWLVGLAADGVSDTVLSAAGKLPINSERVVRVVAMATRDPVNPAEAFGTLDQWRQLADVQIGTAYDAYEDLSEQLDPLGPNAELSREEVLGITDALKKKDLTLLTLFGARRLARFMSTTDALPAS